MSYPISVLQAGKLLGVSHTAVQKAIASGRLVDSVQYVNGKPKIKPELVEGEWLRNTDHHAMKASGGNALKERVEKREAAPSSPKPPRQEPASPKVPAPAPQPPEPEDDTDVEDAGAGKKGPDLNKARAAKSVYEARLAKLEFDQRVGKVVDADAVRAEAFRVARQVRDAMLNIPERIAAQLAAEPETHRCHQILLEEINQALMELANA